MVHLTYVKVGTAVQWGRGRLFDKWYWMIYIYMETVYLSPFIILNIQKSIPD